MISLIFPNLFIRGRLCDQFIQFNDRVIRVNSRCNKYYMNLQITQGNTIYVALIKNADCPNRVSFDGHPSTSKFLLKHNGSHCPHIFTRLLHVVLSASFSMLKSSEVLQFTQFESILTCAVTIFSLFIQVFFLFLEKTQLKSQPKLNTIRERYTQQRQNTIVLRKKKSKIENKNKRETKEEKTISSAPFVTINNIPLS